MSAQEEVKSSLNQTLYRSDYLDKFPPIKYLQSYWKLEEEWVQFHIDNGFRCLRYDGISGSRLLDLGCGPNLLNVIAAPDHFTHIVMADYAEPNLDVIRRWSRGEDIDFDWDHVCKYYRQKHNLDPSWEKTRLANLRTFIKDIVHCDVVKSEPLGPTYTGFFDCVFSSFCLETASRDIDGYNRSVRNVSSLLKEGGYLVMRGAVGERCYTVDGKDFHTLLLTGEQLTSALAGAGFKVRELITESDVTVEVTKPTGFCLVAQKVETNA